MSDRAVQNLAAVLSPDGFRQRIFSDGEWTALMHQLDMSHRQVQILDCLFCGMSDKQIAMVVAIAPATVRTHLSRLFLKTRTDDRVGLVLHIFSRFRHSPAPAGEA